MTITVDSDRLDRWIGELAEITEAAPPAVTRVLFSEKDMEARAWVKERAADAGLSIHDDAAGNIFLRWEGLEPNLPAVATGSHIDAIPNAGRYDGVVGVLGGIEALAAMRQAGFVPRRSLEVIVFTAEEPTRFGIGCLGSRLLAGSLSVERAAALRDEDGNSLDGWRRQADVNGDLNSVKLESGAYSAFLELHIEQGPLLEKAGIPIGVVTAIAGPSSYRLVLEGEGGHAGAVLMPGRRDAALAGAEIALAVEHAALSSGSADTVGTTGVFRIEPGAINSIPFRALLEIDLRDTRLDSRERARDHIFAAAREICERRKVQLKIEDISADAPATSDEEIVAAAESVCHDLGHACQRMVSRAYHDSLFMARVCPTAMLFIPCRNGWSHRPEEYAAPEHIAAGTTVLAHTLARLSIT